MGQQLDDFFIGQAFQRIAVNVPGVMVYVKRDREICYAVLVYFRETISGLTSALQENISRQVQGHLLANGCERVLIQNLMVTENPQSVGGIFEPGQRYWIIDTVNSRLMLYEDQEGDFYGLRKKLENWLYYTGNAAGVYGAANLAGEEEQTSEVVREMRRRFRVSPCNLGIILVNIAVFILCELFGSSEDTFFLLNHGALCAQNVAEQGQVYRLVTYMFLHGGPEHLLNNMLILWFLGDTLEKQIGHVKYLILYFGAGILAGIASMSYNMYIDRFAVCVGASGAIFGVVGAVAWVIIINRGRVENLTTRKIFWFIALSIYGGFTSQGVDNAAHIGGMIAGLVLGVLLYRKNQILRKAEKRSE